MFLLSFQLVLLKETHSQTPTVPRGVRVTVKGGRVWLGDSPETRGWGRGKGVGPNIHPDYTLYMVNNLHYSDKPG